MIAASLQVLAFRSVINHRRSQAVVTIPHILAESVSYEEMLEMIDDGYIVNSVMGAHTANPTSGDFSVTTSSILRVEGGEVIGAVKQAGLSGNPALMP